MKRGIILYLHHTSYINTKDNKVTDFESRKQLGHTEWELNINNFNKIVQAFGNPVIDLFAFRTNTKCRKFVSWHPDPSAYKVDAFTMSCKGVYFMLFHHFL